MTWLVVLLDLLEVYLLQRRRSRANRGVEVLPTSMRRGFLKLGNGTVVQLER